MVFVSSDKSQDHEMPGSVSTLKEQRYSPKQVGIQWQAWRMLGKLSRFSLSHVKSQKVTLFIGAIAARVQQGRVPERGRSKNK